MTTPAVLSDNLIDDHMHIGHDVEEILVCLSCRDPRADLEQALALLEKHEWAGDFMEIHCVECAQTEEHGHAPDCTWANLLSKYNREVRFHD